MRQAGEEEGWRARGERRGLPERPGPHEGQTRNCTLMGVGFAEGRTVQRPQHTGQSGRRQAGSGPEPREDVVASSPSCGAHGTRPGRRGDQTRSICPARSPATPGAPSVTADGAPTCTVRALGLSARTQEQKELGFRLPDALTCRGLKRCCRFPLFQGALLCSRPDPHRAALPTGGPCRRRPRSHLPLLSVFHVFHVRFGLKTPCLKHSVDPFTLNWAASAIARPDAAHLGAGTRTGQHCARPSNQQSPPRSTERPKPGHARHCKSTSPAARWAGTRSRASRNCTCFQGLGRRHAWWLGLRRNAGEQATSQVQKRPATGTDSYNNVMGPPPHARQGHQDNKRTDKPRTEGAGLFPAASKPLPLFWSVWSPRDLPRRTQLLTEPLTAPVSDHLGVASSGRLHRSPRECFLGFASVSCSCSFSK